VQQRHVGVALVRDDVVVERIDRFAPAFDGLQEDPAAVAQNTGDTVAQVVSTGGFQYRFNGFGAVLVDGAADVEQAYQHGGVFLGINGE
jgi:hypothetical protein